MVRVYRWWWALLITLLVLGLYLIPCTSWHFDIDDCGMIWASCFESWQSLIILLYKSCHGNALYAPSNYALALSDSRPLFGTIHSFFRPLTLLFFGIQYHFFGAHPYPYFVLMIFFHALNTGLFFLITQYHYQSLVGAAWAALFFGTHMSYWGWMGWIAAQPYTTSMFLLLSATVSFYYYLTTHKQYFQFGACIFFGLALFLFEFTIVFPLFICSLNLILPKKLSVIRKTTCLWLVTVLFLATRIMISPHVTTSTMSLGTHIKNFILWIPTRTADYISFMVDICNLSFIPAGNQFLKGGLIICIALATGIAVIRNKQKKVLLFCGLNFLLFFWPAILKQYTLRYLYYALPFFAYALLNLIQPEKNRWRMMLCWLIVIGNSTFVIISMISRSNRLAIKTEAIEQLMHNPKLNNKPLCFIALPRGPFASGLAQQLWMSGFDAKIPIFYDPSTFVETPYHANNQDLIITHIPNGIMLTSKNHKVFWWSCFGGETMRLGTKMLLSMDHHGVYAIRYCFEHIKCYNPLLMTWDYEHQTFKLLGPIKK